MSKPFCFRAAYQLYREQKHADAVHAAKRLQQLGIGFEGSWQQFEEKSVEDLDLSIEAPGDTPGDDDDQRG